MEALRAKAYSVVPGEKSHLGVETIREKTLIPRGTAVPMRPFAAMSNPILEAAFGEVLEHGP